MPSQIAMTTSFRQMVWSRGALEFWLSLAVLILLAPMFMSLAEPDDQAVERFSPPPLPAVSLPAPATPKLCAEFSGWLSAEQRSIFCNKEAEGGRSDPGQLVVVLNQHLQAIDRAFREPLAGLRHAAQRNEAAAEDEEGEPSDQQDLMRAYMDRYQLPASGQGGPRSLACMKLVWDVALFEASAQEQIRLGFWIGQVLDGRGSRRRDAEWSAMDEAWKRTRAGCRDYATVRQAMRGVVATLDAARKDAANQKQSRATLALLPYAGIQFACFAMLGLFLIKFARRSDRLRLISTVGVALGLWAIAAWIGQLGLHFLGRFDAQWFWRGHMGPFALQIPISLLVMAAAGVSMYFVGRHPRFKSASTRSLQGPASILGYPVFLLALGVGWITLLDLSIAGHWRNRFLGLYHQDAIWGGFAILSLVAILRNSMIEFITRKLGSLERIFADRTYLGALVAGLIPCALAIGAIVAFRGQPSVTSEIGRLWLMAAAAWFFCFRGDRVDAGSLRYFAPLIAIVMTLAAGMILTKDMGPLMVSMFAAGVFVSAAVRKFLLHRLSGWTPGFWSNAILFVWIHGLITAVFTFGSSQSRVAERIESAQQPLVSINDQMALVTWFRESIPSFGYGVGSVPWCGLALSDNVCEGLPRQVHSDYTFTALAGIFGSGLASVAIIALLFWYYRLAKAQANHTGGSPIKDGALLDRQALSAWMILIWISLNVCQMAITVAGNVGLLPLTGVTFPFVSYGMTSLWINCAMLGMALNVDCGEECGHDHR